MPLYTRNADDFAGLSDLPAGTFDALPTGTVLTPETADVSDQLERKITGISLYESQVDRLFGSQADMARIVREQAARVAALAGVAGGAAERYWRSGLG